MPYQPVENTAQVILSGTVLGEPWANQMFFEHPTGWNLLDLNTLATDMFNWWNTNMRVNLPTSMTLTRVEATDLTTQNGLQSVLSVLATGTQADIAMPNNTALVIEFYTGVRGRAFRGRNFIAGLRESQVTGNTIDGAFVDAMTDAYGEIPAAVSVVGVDHVVVSRQLNGVVLEEGITTDVILYTCDGKVHTMRRRMPD